MMDYEALIEQVRIYAGVPKPSAAERLIHATVHALGNCLPIVDRELWVRCLPPELHGTFRSPAYRGAITTAHAFAAVPAITGVPQPYAREQAEAVVRVLAQPLERDERELLARHLPAELGVLVLAPPYTQFAAESGEARSPSGVTLAAGAAGSARPVVTARPLPGQSGSVGAWDDRRMDRSLGAGREGDANTLASGRPGSKRSLAG